MAPTRLPLRRRGRRELSGLRALVTGGSAGVGRAVSLALAARGTRVLATARRGDRLAALASTAGGGTAAVTIEAGDITDDAFRERLVAIAQERLGGLDLVVACAGAGAIGPFRHGSPATFARIIDVDFLAPAELVRRCLPLLDASPDPAVVFVGSMLGIHPLPLHGEYCAAKAALRSLAGTLRLELEADGIDVMLASLGPTRSEFWESLLAGARPAWSRGRPMTAELAAAAILGGVERRRAEIAPGWQARGYAWATRFAPRLLDVACRARMRREGALRTTPGPEA